MPQDQHQHYPSPDPRPRLRIEEYQIGRISWTKVAVLYIEGVASKEVLGAAQQDQ